MKLCFVKVAQDRFSYIDAKFFPRIRFGHDGVAEGAGDETPVGIVLRYLKYDFTHEIQM
jgi:hypothetical protein